MKLIFGGAYQGKLDYALQLITQTTTATTTATTGTTTTGTTIGTHTAVNGINHHTGTTGTTTDTIGTEGTLVYTCPDIRSCDTPEDCLAALDLSGEIAKAEKAAGGTAPGAPLVIDHLERMVYAFIDAGRDPVAYIKEHPEIWEGRIVIIEDISQGVVPIDTKERAWREANGRVMAYLAGKAETVTRIFCGIPQVLKQK